MNTRYLPSTLLMAGMITLSSPAAQASDELAGALLGAGAGAVVGHVIGGNNGAVVGGFLGAIVGVAVADDHPRPVAVRPHPHVGYGPAPVRYYAPPPPWAGPRHAHHQWHHDRDGRHDGDWRRGRDGWRDGRHEQDRNGRGPRSDGPRDYRNW